MMRRILMNGRLMSLNAKSNIDVATMKKSSWFQGSRTYEPESIANPKETTLIMNSPKNSHVIVPSAAWLIFYTI